MRDRIAGALKDALDKQDKRRISTLRLVQTAIKDRDAASRAVGKDPVSDAEIGEILLRMLRQREESAAAYEAGGRLELAEEEREEMQIIRELLPKPLGEEALRDACAEVVKEVGAEGLRDMRRCMTELERKFPGRMDLGKASSIVKTMLR